MKHSSLFLFTIFCFTELFTHKAFATIYDVNSLDVTNTGNGNSGTLLYCINQANASSGPHAINFSVAGTISLNSELPALNQSITIDGTTAPGYNGIPVIIISGGNLGSGNGIEVSSANCKIYGLEVSLFPYNGIVVSGNGSDYFQIGTAGKGNIIINNGYRGIQIDKADNGMIAYNKIGVEASGFCASNGYDGIDMLNNANDDSIYFNHISCNEYNGIQVGGCDGTVIKGNIIGPLANDCAGNAYRGIDLEDGTDNSIVGGTTPSEFNKITGNSYWGIEVKNTSVNNLLSGNVYLCNVYGAIEINAGGNNYMEAPWITSANSTTIIGTSPDNSVIEVFKSQNTNPNQCQTTPGNQGADFLGTTTADANGDWSLSGTFGGFVVATARDATGNTSEFSTAVSTGVDDTLVNACEGSILNVFVQAGFEPSALEICQKNCLDFTDASQNAVSWQWYFPGGSPDQSTEQNPVSICYNVSGDYDVTQVAYDTQGDSSMAVITISVNATPPIPEVTLENDSLFSTSAFSYQWYFNGDIIPGATDQFYVPTDDGFYYVQVQDSNGCISNSIAMNVILSGIQNVTENEFVVVQSITEEGSFQITSQLLSSRSFLLRVFDATGKQLHEENLSALAGFSEKKVKLNHVSTGIYFVTLRDPGYYHHTSVFIR